MSHHKYDRVSTPSVGNCPITLDNGGQCPRRSRPDMPFPICAEHALMLYRFMQSRMVDASYDEHDRLRVMLSAMAEQNAKNAAVEDKQQDKDCVVYYVQIGEHIKIGTTGNLMQRLCTYPPSRRLLATEPGSFSVEARRLREFGEYLAMGNEWFNPGSKLIDHINTLRPQHRQVDMIA